MHEKRGKAKPLEDEAKRDNEFPQASACSCSPAFDAVYAIFHHHGTGFNNEGKAIIPYITAATTTASMAYKNIWNISIFPVACSAVMYILPTEIA
jgi:hypothetical protein